MAAILYESYYGIMPLDSNIIEHSGTKGMKWHNRRFQYYDGSLTPAGRERYGVGPARDKARTDKHLTKNQKKHQEAKAAYEELKRTHPDLDKEYMIKTTRAHNAGLNRAPDYTDEEEAYANEITERINDIRRAEKKLNKLTIGEKLDTFKRDLAEGKKIARAEKAEAKEERDKEREAAAKKKADAKAKAEADKKAKEEAKEQEILRGVIARANVNEVAAYIPRLSTKQLEEVKARIGLQKDLVKNKEEQLKSQKAIDEIRKAYADAEAKAKAERREERKEKIAKAWNTGKAIIDKINRVDDTTRAAKAKAQEIIEKNREEAATRLGTATRAAMENAKASAYETAKAVDKVIIDTMTGGKKPKQTAEDLVNDAVSAVTRRVSDSRIKAENVKSTGERIAETIADKSVKVLDKATGKIKQVANKAAENYEEKRKKKK